MKYEQEQEVLRFSFKGEFDNLSVMRIKDESIALIERFRPKVLKLDFADVTFVDSSGIGYVLARDYWNHGYVTEALRTVIDRLFADGVQVVQAEHNVNNPASGRVMEKCGMVFTHFSKSQVKFDSDALCGVKWYEIRNPSEPGEQEGDHA